MTLVITTGTRQLIGQVSDRRLTDSNTGVVCDDEANKAVILECSDALLAISFTGLGQIGSSRTDRWLIATLTGAKAGQLNIENVVRALATAATRDFSQLRLPSNLKCHTFVLAGWYYGEGFPRPIIWSVSNSVDQNWTPLLEPSAEFKCKLFRLKTGKRLKRAMIILTHGTVPALDGHYGRRPLKQLKKLLKRAGNDLDIRDKLVEIVRIASGHPEYGQYIGRSCMSLLLRPDRHIAAKYHPSDRSESVGYAPYVILPEMSFTDVRYSRAQPYSLSLGPRNSVTIDMF